MSYIILEELDEIADEAERIRASGKVREGDRFENESLLQMGAVFLGITGGLMFGGAAAAATSSVLLGVAGGLGLTTGTCWLMNRMIIASLDYVDGVKRGAHACTAQPIEPKSTEKVRFRRSVDHTETSAALRPRQGYRMPVPMR